MSNEGTFLYVYLVQVGQVVVYEYQLAQALQNHQQWHAPHDSVPMYPFQQDLL